MSVVERRLIIALPDEEIARRLCGLPGGVRIIVWDLGDPAPDVAIDLLVLRYMIPAAELRGLAAVSVTVAQSQTLGFDGVSEALPAGIVYCNAVDVHEASTGELALALILASQRGIGEAVTAQPRGEWAHAQHPGLAGKTVLLIGVGGVGREIESRLAPFDARIVRVGRSARTDARGEVHGMHSLGALLPGADIVVLAVPLVGDTHHLVDAGFLGLLRPGALVVNVARGGVVDTAALVDWLGAGRGRAAVDVTDPEPLPADHPLWTLPGVIVTPHLGGHTDAMAGRVDRVVLEQVRRMRAGEPPLNPVLGG
ncbi:2-hydroxyacid dehydrogenase [Marisediminicola antarctica]